MFVYCIYYCYTNSGYFFIFDPDQWSMPGYDEVIARPVSMSTISHRLRTDVYSGTTSDSTADTTTTTAVVATQQLPGALTAAFADDVRLMWENCWCYNHEGTGPWAAATTLSAVFERLLREWVLSDSPPAIDALLSSAEGRPCSSCRASSSLLISSTSSDAHKAAAAAITAAAAAATAGSAGAIILCDRCDAVYHLACLVPPLAEAPRNEWFCPCCVAQGTSAEAAAAAAVPLAPCYTITNSSTADSDSPNPLGAGYGCASRLNTDPPFLSGISSSHSSSRQVRLMMLLISLHSIAGNGTRCTFPTCMHSSLLQALHITHCTLHC
jgi:Bromodomain/PHD-finger